MRKYRKWLWLFIVMALAFTGCGTAEKGKEKLVVIKDPAPAVETPPETEEIQSGYYYGQLSAEEKEIYRQILKGIQSFETEIKVSSTDKEAIDKVYGAILCDRMEVFWVKNASTYYTTMYEDYSVFEPNYGKTKEEAESLASRIEEAANAQVAEIQAAAETPYDKVKAVYEYIIQTTQYQDSEDDQNIVSVFENHQSVCAGYASSVKYLLDKMDIPCIYVQGTALDTNIGHAWNIVNIDGEYYYVDATYGDPDSATQQGEAKGDILDSITLYDYLCPVPGDYESLCKPDEGFQFPVCQSEAYNYYERKGNYFREYNFDEIYQYCRQQIDGGASDMMMKFATQEVYQQALEDLFSDGNLDKLSQYYMKVQGLSHVEFQYGNVEGIHLIRFVFG